MRIRIAVTVGDKVIADSYQEDDAVFIQRRFPSTLIKQANDHCMSQMAEAIERAITELYAKGTVQKPTSYPPRRLQGNAYSIRGDVS